MAKTTNILDLNNRLEKVEKENIAQNSYTSLKNKPKINNVTLTGNKSLADIGAAAASDLATLAGDVGDKTQLNTTDKSSTVAAINEVNTGLSNLNFGNFRAYPIITAPYDLAAVGLPRANSYTISHISILGGPEIPEAIDGVTDGYTIEEKREEYGYMFIKLVGSYATTYVGKALNLTINIQ